MLMSMDVTRDDGRAQVMNQAIWPDHAHCVTALHLRIEVATAAWRRRVLLSNRYEFLVVCLQHLQLDDACTLMRSFFHPEWLGLGGSLSTEPKKSLLRALRHSTPIDGTEYLLAFMLNERGKFTYNKEGTEMIAKADYKKMCSECSELAAARQTCIFFSRGGCSKQDVPKSRLLAIVATALAVSMVQIVVFDEQLALDLFEEDADDGLSGDRSHSAVTL